MHLSIQTLVDYEIAFGKDYMHLADKPRPILKGLDAVLSLTDIITLCLSQESNVEKRKISQCSSRTVSEPAVPFHSQGFPSTGKFCFSISMMSTKTAPSP